MPTPAAVLLLVSQVLCRFAMGGTAIDAGQPSTWSGFGTHFGHVQTQGSCHTPSMSSTVAHQAVSDADHLCSLHTCVLSYSNVRSCHVT